MLVYIFTCHAYSNLSLGLESEIYFYDKRNVIHGSNAKHTYSVLKFEKNISWVIM